MGKLELKVTYTVCFVSFLNVVRCRCRWWCIDEQYQEREVFIHALIFALFFQIPSLSNVNKEPIVVELDKLELVLTETLATDGGPSTPE